MVANLRTLHDAGVPLAVGSDGGNIGSFHGPSFHTELGLLSEAGLTPMEIILAATYNGARAIGRLQDLGTLEEGKLSDLVVLQADPLERVENLAAVAAVVVRGTYLTTQELDSVPD